MGQEFKICMTSGIAFQARLDQTLVATERFYTYMVVDN